MSFAAFTRVAESQLPLFSLAPYLIIIWIYLDRS